MGSTGIISIILIIANIIFSYKGFTDNFFFGKYEFEVEKVLLYKDYKRLLTSGFLHVNWTHLVFNMLSLYIFSGSIEGTLGPIKFLIIYFASLIGGNLLALLINRNNKEYSSVGASGAICGIMFASIALFPGMGIGFFILPISIPGWIYGVLFIGFSIYGIRSNKTNIGHEAHLGGALIGMVVALIMQPSAFIENYFTILVITVPTIIFIYIIIKKPGMLLVDNLFYRTSKDFYSIDQKYNFEKNLKQKEVDRILDKISKHGMNSLSKREKDTLKEYSETIK